ncbi:restriction endonuclease [Sporocytophaga myxococcoides]|uniref:restriction endonuclease n=1 Tax=Sporocytophaga myxococcoides TaxID=153721 RepID=UPI00041695E8|nr:restriction endonuclease [Sporocytophaga myxococcoides]
MQLDFSELETKKNPKEAGKRFEELVAAYFRKLKEDPINRIMDVKVEPSGEGGDGGRDILVTFNINDSVVTFSRKWVIQCKFHNSSISTSHLNKVNIPSLIHQYSADGYLLICKDVPAISTTNMFESLRKNCRFCYNYEIWSGSRFKDLLYTQTDIHKSFFPKYYQETLQFIRNNK